MLDAVTAEDLQAIVHQLIQQARQGDVPSARLVFSYTLGKPDKAVDPDSLDQQEWQQFRQNAVPNQELLGLLQLLQAPLASSILRAALPHLQQQMAQSLAQQLNQPPEDTEPETDQDTEAAPEQPQPTASSVAQRLRQEETGTRRAEPSQTPRPAAREQPAPDCRTASEFLAERPSCRKKRPAGSPFFRRSPAWRQTSQPPTTSKDQR